MGVLRSFDAGLLTQAVEFFTKKTIYFDPEEWVHNERNIILMNEIGDVAVFEAENEGVVTGHYFFKSRGKKALQTGRDFLDEIFKPCYNIQLIKGLTPLQNLGARWISRQLGFQSYGVTQSDEGPLEIFILTRKDYEQ